MWRGITTVAITAAILAGCLFPSFDDLNGTGAASTQADAGKTTSSSSSTSGSSGSSSSSSSGSTTSSSSGDASTPDAGTLAVKTVVCDSHVCDLATTICCDGVFSGAECKPPGTSCENWTFTCDGKQDCPSGQNCCHQLGTFMIACTNDACNGDTVCQPDAPECPAGQACTGTVTATPNVTSHTCE